MSEGSAQTELVEVDAGKQKQINKYLHARRTSSFLWSCALILALIPFIIPTGYAAITGILAKPWFAAHPLAGWYPLRLMAIYLCIAAMLAVLFFPYSFFSSFLFPRVYKIRQRTFPVWFIGWLLVITITAVRWLLVFELCYLLIIVQPNSWWIWVTLILSLISIGKSYIIPTFFFSLFYKCTDITDEQLKQTLTELTMRSQTRVQRFFQIASKTRNEAKRKELPANGYLAGWGKTRSIILTDSLIHHFTPAEIRCVLAHELGHHTHHDIGKTLALNFFLLAGELYIFNLIEHWFIGLFQSQVGAFQQAEFWFLLGYSTFYGIRLLKQVYSRHNERRADEFALRLTGDVVAFKNMMIRLTNINHTPLTLTLKTHPATLSRLKHADKFAARMAPAILSEATNAKPE